MVKSKFSWLRCVALVVGIVSATFGVQAASYTTYTWQAVDGNYNGSFTDSAHWTPAQTGYPGQSDGVIVNANQLAVFPRVDDDYTVTLPAGVVTNVATPQFYAQAGKTLTIDGSQTTWVMPTLADNTMTYGDLRFYTGNRDAGGNPANGSHFFSRLSGKDTPTALGTFKNFQVELASQTASIDGTRLTFTGDLDWTGGGILMHHGAAAGSKAEVVFANGSMKTMPGLGFGFSNATNILTFDSFDGGLCNGSIQYQIWQGPCLGNGLPGLFEFNLLNGSTFTSESYLALGYSWSTYTSDGKTFRLNVKGGSHLSLYQLDMNNRGHYELNVVGAGSKCEITGTTQVNYFSTSACSTSRVVVADGAYFRCADYLYLGGETAEKAATTYAEAIFSNATAEIRRNMRLGHGKLTLVGGTKLTFYGYESDCLFHSAGVEGYPSELYVDDATVSFTQTGQLTMLQDFTAAKVGKKGLTLSADTAAAKNYTIPQNFSDWTSGGTVRARGGVNSAIILSGADSRESNLVVDRGTVYLASGANHYSHVVVTNGATFSLVGGQTAPTLRGLTLGSAESRGTIALDPGTVVTVDGPIAFVNPHISFSSTLGVGTHTVFRQTVEPDSDTVVTWEALLRGTIDQGLPADKFSHLQVVRSGGDWLYQIVVSDSSLPSCEGTTTWSGSGSEWSAPGSWTGGALPDATHEAVFGGSEALSVAVSGTVDASGVSFGNDEGVVVSGGRIRISENMDAEIAASSGENEISSAVQMSSRVAVPVAAGATLTVSGEVTGGGFAKSGAGRLVVENAANKMPDGFGLGGGWLEFTTLGAFGYVFDTTLSDLVSGTLEYTGASGATRAATAVSGPVVIKSESELTMPLPSATAGAIIKRGAGRLIFDVSADTTLALAPSSGDGFYTRGESVTYPADGSAPAKYSAVSVNEGELVFRGSGATVPKVTLQVGSTKQAMAVGVPVSEHSGEVGAQPGLVIDHVNLTCNKIGVGHGITASETFVREPYVVITNGGVLSASFDATGGNPDNEGIRVYADNGTIFGSASLNLDQSTLTTNRYMFVNRSGLYGYRHTFNGSEVMVFSNSVWAWSYDATDRSKWKACAVINYSVQQQALVDWTFAGGSLFACNELEFSQPSSSRSNPHTLRFDNSEWWGGSGDRVFATASLNITTVVSGTGLIQQPAAGQTYTWITPVVGEGGFVKRGAGTVVFAPQQKYHAAESDPVTLGYSGLTDVEEGLFMVEPTAISNFTGRSFRIGGTLDMMGGTLAAPQFVAAGGTVSNVVCSLPTVVVDIDDFSPITLDFANGFSMSGHLKVDFGRGSDDEPLPLGSYTVARWTGGENPQLPGRVVNVGKDMAGVVWFREDGRIEVTVVHKQGLTIFVR